MRGLGWSETRGIQIAEKAKLLDNGPRASCSTYPIAGQPREHLSRSVAMIGLDHQDNIADYGCFLTIEGTDFLCTSWEPPVAATNGSLEAAAYFKDQADFHRQPGCIASPEDTAPAHGRVPIRTLPAVVGERLVGFGHLVGI